MTQFFWDSGTWDAAEWAGTPPGEGGWGDDWSWWYQVKNYTPAYNLNPYLVEARWTTDGHSLGDGTFRGDIQPGTLTARFWDPKRHLVLDKTGAVWAFYQPTGACWCWFYDTFSRGLFAPGDPSAADCVFVGTSWPSRLTAPTLYSNYPAQSVSARLNAVVASWTAASPGFVLPAVTGNIASQNQTVLAAPIDSSGYYPPFLQTVRDAAAPGAAWLSAAPVNVGDASAGGRLVLNYARWETNVQRTLDRSQIVAGPPTTASTDWMITVINWAATNGSTGVQTKDQIQSSSTALWGLQGPGALRLWGDVTYPGGTECSAAEATARQLINDRANASEQQLSSISLQSGTRWTAAGKPSSADWDPYAHTFSPTDVAAIVDDGGTTRYYRVQKSDHRLTSNVWQTTHYLEKYTAPTPLPA
ncbi:MAG TPA: hypothetical protein VFE26_15625 [Trebonia sp.]|jgi:hypothetical protein|nr:hypothetical protein [Trebonia sp.]